MKTQRIHEQHGEKTFAVVFAKGDEVVAGLQQFAEEWQVTAAYFTAVGAFRDVVFGYCEREMTRTRPLVQYKEAAGSQNMPRKAWSLMTLRAQVIDPDSLP